MCVRLNDVKLLAIYPVSACPVDSDGLCRLLNTQHGCLCLNGSLNLPPTAHPLIHAIRVITVALRKAAENPPVLAS